MSLGTKKMSPPTGVRHSLWREIVKNKHIYLMILPGIVFFVIFRYGPMYGLQLAFRDFSLRGGITGSEWVGLKHFQRLTFEPEFFTAFKNTIFISLLRIVWGFPAPIILAIMINQITLRRSKRVLQTIYSFPHFLSWVIVAGLALNLFGENGAIKKLLVLFMGHENVEWDFLYNKGLFRGFLIASDIWKEAGWGTIIYLAAMAGVDPSLYEAATIDGCNRAQ